MKRLITTAITDTAKFPLKKGSLEFIQDAYKEGFDALAKTLIGASYSPTVPYILNGCKNTGTSTNYIISAGSIFYAGEIYLVDATAFTSDAVVTLNFATTQFNVDADPVTFTDATVHNVHNIKKIAISFGAGFANYADCVFVNVAKDIFTIKKTVKWNMDVEEGLWVDMDLPAAYRDVNVSPELVASKIINFTSLVKGYQQSPSSNWARRYSIGAFGSDISSTIGGCAAIVEVSNLDRNSTLPLGYNRLSILLTRITGGVFDSANYNNADVSAMVTFDNSL